MATHSGGQLMATKDLVPRFLTSVEMDPPTTPAPAAEKPAARRRGRPRDGETETIHQYTVRVHAVVMDVLSRFFRDKKISITEEIVRGLERPFVIAMGPRAGHSVSGLEHESKSVISAINRTVIAGQKFSLQHSDEASLRPGSYLSKPRGRRALANAITLAILTEAGRGMTFNSLHRILKRTRPSTPAKY